MNLKGAAGNHRTNGRAQVEVLELNYKDLNNARKNSA